MLFYVLVITELYKILIKAPSLSHNRFTEVDILIRYYRIFLQFIEAYQMHGSWF